jgi:sigma-B regulation protein RsbU (phosphoserine phosphatase)
MKIQWKYIFIAMGISLMPLWIGAIITHYETNFLELRLSKDIRECLPEDSNQFLYKEIIKKQITGYKQKQFIIILIISVSSILLLTGVAYFGCRKLGKCLSDISSIFDRLAKGDFSVRLFLQTGDEWDQVITSFNHMVSIFDESLNINKSLHLAQKVQQNLLPRSAPKIPGLDIAGASIYCNKIGGDYYDFFKVGGTDENRFAIIVGDVSGHGVSSALLMATARAMIRLRASIPAEVGTIITDVNRLLAADTYDTGHFMSLFYCEFDMNSGRVRWVRAGHEPAILYDQNTGEFGEFRDRRSLLLGVDKYFQYNAFEKELIPGQMIVIGTDGIWEMQNSIGEMFGMDRFREVIRNHASDPAKEIQRTMIDTLKAFRGEKEPEDDVTLVIIKVLPF